MTSLHRATLTGLLLLLLVATAHAGRIVATDSAPEGGVRIDATTGEKSDTGPVVLDAATGKITAFRLPDGSRPVRPRDGGVALARLASGRFHPTPAVAVPAVTAPVETPVAIAQVGSPFGPPTGGWALLFAGLVGVSAWFVRSRLRPAYT